MREGRGNETQEVYLSIGSNLGDREGNLRTALRLLGERFQIIAVSSIYGTMPVGVTDQPEFLNQAVVARTDLDPAGLLAFVKEVEREVGRRPTYRWGPRVVDIDIVLYGEDVVDTPDLTIPHREMHRRAFVLIPLAEIAPSAAHPVLHRSVRDLAASVDGAGDVWRIDG